MSKPPELPNNNEFLRWLETVDDPAERFALASKVLAQQSEAGSRLAAIRAAAAAATYEGSSYGQVAARTRHQPQPGSAARERGQGRTRQGARRLDKGRLPEEGNRFEGGRLPEEGRRFEEI